jgi:hypothetical protein
MLVVVTLLSGWLAWELHIVHARKAFASTLRADDVRIEYRLSPEWPKLSMLRRLLGDRECASIAFPEGSNFALAQRAKALFPESWIGPDLVVYLNAEGEEEYRARKKRAVVLPTNHVDLP